MFLSSSPSSSSFFPSFCSRRDHAPSPSPSPQSLLITHASESRNQATQEAEETGNQELRHGVTGIRAQWKSTRRTDRDNTLTRSLLLLLLPLQHSPIKLLRLRQASPARTYISSPVSPAQDPNRSAAEKRLHPRPHHPRPSPSPARCSARLLDPIR